MSGADVTLFDDLLSPDTENKPIVDPDILCSSDSMALVNDRELLHADMGTSPLQEGRSMENILLDITSMEESIDLGNSSVPVGGDDTDEDIFLSMLSVSGNELLTGADATSTDHADTPAGREQHVVEPSAIEPAGEKGVNLIPSQGTVLEGESTVEPRSSGDISISKYFQAHDTVDIFDTLASSTTEKLTLEETDLPPASEFEADETSKSRKKVRVHLESHSSVSDEVTPVDFEEDKGQEPLRPTPSTRSLAKYFNADGTEAGDDAKSFFDTFTVSEKEESLGLSCSSSGFPSLEQPLSESGGVIPPETPQIPIGSPMPSPFHLTSAPPSATDQHSFFLEPSEKPLTNQTPVASLPDLVPQSAQFLVADPDDPFTIGLNISDLDRRHDAWIPSEITRQVLITVMTSPPGTVTLQSEQITMPGLVQDEPLGDPVRDLVHRFMGDHEAQKRTCLTADSVAQDETGIRQLIKAECWRSAVDLTGRLLTECGQGIGKVNTPTKHTPYTLQLWFCRLSLLIRLRLYTQAEAECQTFGNMDKPDVYYECYQDKYPGRRGSIVPFGLRLIHAEIPHHLGKTQESLDRIYYLHAIVKKILSNLEAGLAEDGGILTLSAESRRASRELWECREIKLLYSVANCLLNIKDYNTTLNIFEELVKKDTENKSNLACAMARIYLQMGDTMSAKKHFTRAEKAMKTTESQSKCQNYMNMGFLSLGQNQFKEAYDCFKNAVTLDNSNATALNNMAVCSLYTGNLSDSLGTLEGLVSDNPDLYLQEGILFNLCTLYELESSNAIFRKQKLLSMVSQHKGNGFNVACLKMN